MKIKIGICGYMGAGKSVVAQLLADKFNAELIVADCEAKMLMDSSTEIKSQLSSLFGVVEDGRIDYKKLGGIVFGCRDSMDKLNGVVHPPLIELLKNRVVNSDKSVILDAALIPLWGIEDSFDLSFWVNAPVNTRISRIMQRNGFDRSLAKERVASQHTLFSNSDKNLIIDNSSDINSLKRSFDLINFGDFCG